MERNTIYEKLQTVDGIASLLSLEDFSPVYGEADRVRRAYVGDTVHLRAIIEFSNVCKRQCRYCGLNRDNRELSRYRMSREEIFAAAREAVSAGYRTIVLQSGEDDYFTAERLGAIVADIKKLPAYPTVTISCGEKTETELRHLREMGADRYLLKHETADPVLYDKLHPCGTLAERVACLKTIQALGYETGSGFMIGLPGQMPETIARDLLLLKEIPCKMAGIGPFIANPKTPLGDAENGDPELVRRAVALTRLLLPEANLPLTTALSILSTEEKNRQDSRECGTFAEGKAFPIKHGEPQEPDRPMANPFAFGANVIMKKVTPDVYKQAYEIYPAKYERTDIAADRRELERMIRHFGRVPL